MSSGSFTPSIKVEHVISFSDAVFAFAITLMALSIDIPDLPSNLTQAELLDKLYDLFPQFESYIISFAVIALFWVSYHQVFNHIKGSHIVMVYLNLLFLLLITLLSLSTSLVINYGNYHIPYVIYSFIVILTSSLLTLIWWHATKDKLLIDKNLHPLYIKGVMLTLVSIPLVFTVSIFISFINLDIAEIFWLVMVPINITIKQKYKYSN
ncbi:MAG TPA: TMEM175 family protein [Nitrososphaeraceae archaeon]|nr:TMEM175 family protein [Nitrososphaeraceae archaeon]